MVNFHKVYSCVLRNLVYHHQRTLSRASGLLSEQNLLKEFKILTNLANTVKCLTLLLGCIIVMARILVKPYLIIN